MSRSGRERAYLRRAAIACILASVAAAGTIFAASLVKLRPTAPILADSKGVALRQPEGVACRAASVVVSDTGNGRLVRFTATPRGFDPAGEIVLAQLPSPLRVQIDSKGEILALDGKTHRIARLGAAGEFKGYIDLASDAATGTVVPKSFRLGKDDSLYVLDVFGARVLVMSPEGKLVRQVPFPAESRFISDLAVNGKGEIFLLDSVGRRIFHAPPASGSATALSAPLTEEVDFPTAIAADDAGRLYVADHDGGWIVILGQDGSFQGQQSGIGWKEGLLRYPSDLCLCDGGTLYVADRQNNRVQVFVLSQ